MNIVLGASGQIGSAIVDALLKEGKPVKGVCRSPQKADKLKSKGIAVEIADFFDLEALKKAFKGGDTIFLLTPENPSSEDILADTESILKNYREAIRFSGIKKVIGLSSIGAQHQFGTGNLQMSYMLEHTFQDLSVKQIFIRPAYYYSNWMAYFETAKEYGVLPTFFPAELKIPMVAPTDVAAFIAKTMTDEAEQEKVYELVGPVSYSSTDVAHLFGNRLNRKVEAQQIPQGQWSETLKQIGFSTNATDNLIKMIEAVINGKAKPEKEKTDLIKLPTPLESYLEKNIK